MSKSKHKKVEKGIVYKEGDALPSRVFVDRKGHVYIREYPKAKSVTGPGTMKRVNPNEFFVECLNKKKIEVVRMTDNVLLDPKHWPSPDKFGLLAKSTSKFKKDLGARGATENIADQEKEVAATLQNLPKAESGKVIVVGG